MAGEKKVRKALGLGHRWWDKRWEDGGRVARGDYFIFVEEGSPVRTEGLAGPADTPINVTDLGGRAWRFRSTGIEAEKFVRAQRRIAPIAVDAPDPAARRRRRDELLTAFRRTPLPIIDIFLTEDDDDLPFLRSILTPGSWYWIGVRRRDSQNGDERLRVYLGEPEIGADPFSPQALQYLEAIPPYLEFRLRDIFSLSHIPDAGEDDIGGEGPPPPESPREPDESKYRSLEEPVLVRTRRLRRKDQR